MKVWITKYALSSGVRHVEGEADEDGYLCAEGITSGFRKKDWASTEDDMRRQALKLIGARRKSIAKQLVKLDAMEKKYAADPAKA